MARSSRVTAPCAAARARAACCCMLRPVSRSPTANAIVATTVATVTSGRRRHRWVIQVRFTDPAPSSLRRRGLRARQQAIGGCGSRRHDGDGVGAIRFTRQRNARNAHLVDAPADLHVRFPPTAQTRYPGALAVAQLGEQWAGTDTDVRFGPQAARRLVEADDPLLRIDEDKGVVGGIE